MPKEIQPTIIESVTVSYTGTDEDFNRFLRAVVHDYLTHKALPPPTEDVEKPPAFLV